MPGVTGNQGAAAINGNNIVGDYTDGSGQQHGYLYNGTTWTTLDMPGATATSAEGIYGNDLVGAYHVGSAPEQGSFNGTGVTSVPQVVFVKMSRNWQLG